MLDDDDRDREIFNELPWNNSMLIEVQDEDDCNSDDTIDAENICNEIEEKVKKADQ